MASPVYCILSGGTVHCIPVTVFAPTAEKAPEKLPHQPPIQSETAEPKALYYTNASLKNKSLLYTLNNPSLSDLESDNTPLAHTGDEDEDKPDTLKNGFVKPFPNPRLHLNNEQAGSDSEDDLHTHMSLEMAEEQGIDRILTEYTTHAVYMPEYTVDLESNLCNDFTQIKSLLVKIFPAWNTDIKVKQLTGGITNMLLSCTHGENTLLMRVYGQGTNLIIDRNREFVSHLVLNSLHLAPPMHARFRNGLIYGFFPGRSLEPHEMSHPALYPLIAQKLGQLHNSVNAEYIEDGVEKLRKYTANVKKEAQKAKPARREKKPKRTISSIWDLIEDWIQIVPANAALVEIFKSNLPSQDITLDNIREVILAEFKWLKSTLLRSSKSPVVVSHCDLLSGNIIIPEDEAFTQRLSQQGAVMLPDVEENPIRFIDYEYMLPAPRAFDTANHFAEWQGFDCNRAAIPKPSASNPVMYNWCKSYLNNENATEDEVRALIHEIACYYGMPGFYWGIWAMIQSELSNIDFNYADYSKLRLEEYWLWKKDFVA